MEHHPTTTAYTFFSTIYVSFSRMDYKLGIILNLNNFFFLFYSSPCGILVPWPEVGSFPTAVETWHLDHRTTREVSAAAKSFESCPTLYNHRDGSPPGSSVPWIHQARTLEWVAISFSNAWKWKWSRSVVSDSSDPMDCSLPGSSVHGIFPLEWGAIAFSTCDVICS